MLVFFYPKRLFCTKISLQPNEADLFRISVNDKSVMPIGVAMSIIWIPYLELCLRCEIVNVLLLGLHARIQKVLSEGIQI